MRHRDWESTFLFIISTALCQLTPYSQTLPSVALKPKPEGESPRKLSYFENPFQTYIFRLLPSTANPQGQANDKSQLPSAIQAG